MTFEPPRCPNRACPQHEQPESGFFSRNGYYQPRCRVEPVPRFRCRHCSKGFSRQTFRHDYGDRRPETNERVFRLLVSGVGIRQTARLVELDMNSVQMKMRKIARTCRLLHDNLSPELPAGCSFLLDEEETYEGASIRTLTMPVLMERETWFVVGAEVAPIRRLSRKGTRRRRQQDRDEQRHGKRRDGSRASVRKVLQRLAARVAEGALTLQTDEKSSYRLLSREIFGDRVAHETTSSKLARGTYNALFPINTTLAMTRDNNGRLRRRSWLVTKLAACLFLQMQLFLVYRNYIRRRFNRDGPAETPARLLGLLPRELREHEALAWRQDWGPRSIHPMSPTAGSTVSAKLTNAA